MPTSWLLRSEDGLTAVEILCAADRPLSQVRELSYVPVDDDYPARRRAERLSWLVHAVIGDQKVGVNAFGGSPYQALIEADDTAERLRLCLIRLREIVSEIRK